MAQAKELKLIELNQQKELAYLAKGLDLIGFGESNGNHPSI
jgi:hypothetical protein